MYKSSYWFEYPGMHMKATTALCASLNDLHGMRVQYKGYPLIQGKVGGYGVLHTPYVYVFWDRIPLRDEKNNDLGRPCALPDNFYLLDVTLTSTGTL